MNPYDAVADENGESKWFEIINERNGMVPWRDIWLNCWNCKQFPYYTRGERRIEIELDDDDGDSFSQCNEWKILHYSHVVFH